MAKLDLFNRKAIKQLQAELDAIKARASSLPEFAGAYADVQSMQLPDPSVYANQAELFARLSWVCIAIDFAANAFASLPLSVVKAKGEDTEEIPNHEFEQLLKHPQIDTNFSQFELMYNTAAYYSLCGNAYWWLNKGNEKSAPDEVWVIPPGQIVPIPDKKLWIKGYWYDPGDGSQIFLEPWDVVHFKGFHPKDQFMGMSKIEPIATDAEADIAAGKWNAKFFRDSNGKLPSVLAFADNIPDTEWAIIKKDIGDAANKRQMMMLRNVKAGGVQWLQASATQKDMEFLNSRNFTKEEIFAIFAPGLASILAINATEANSKTGKATFAEYKLWPMCQTFAQKITAAVLPAYGEGLEAEYEDPRQSDRQLELAEMAEYSKTHTVDQINEKYWGDKPIAEVTGIESDNRGILFPAQISSGTPAPSDEEPEEETPEPNPFETMTPVLEETPVQGEPAEADDIDETEDAEEPYVKGAELRAELKKWQRKCQYYFKHGKGEKRGAYAEFISPSIPLDMYAAIKARLEKAESEADIKAAFTTTITPVLKEPAPEVLEMGLMVLEGIKKAIDEPGES